MPCRIELSEIELQLRIGCTEDERREPQPVRFRAAVRSEERFPASHTDRVEDTVDAGALRSALIDTARATRARTLERLAAELEAELTRRFGRTGLAWELMIRKPRFGWSYTHEWKT